MKTRIFTFLLLCVLSNILLAKHSDDFMIGGYSCWKTYGDYPTVSDSVFRRMNDCGYNAATCVIYSEANETEISNMFEKLDAYGQDAIVTDFAWDAMQTNDKFGVHGFSLSNYQTYEAEYSNQYDVRQDDRKDDRYYYSSRVIDWCDTLRVGTDAPLQGKSMTTTPKMINTL